MPENSISLCTDGAVQVEFGKAAAGGVLRNGNMEWIMGLETVKAIQESSLTNSSSALIRRIDYVAEYRIMGVATYS
ncbi:hypothetical protein Goshw_014307 [Gossypium schwendimanii]|uniref:RNase H type-1 domain-containing protein n=1 Tax=Gossypium schwendimanii TaxID=34291 RepID=A0A7J9KS06_GOSSC|nr:hypothetical protein [Gossypium schwendimanii]